MDAYPSPSGTPSPSVRLAAATLRERWTSQGGALLTAIKQPAILLPAVFVFFWQATPTAGDALFYFYTNRLGFTPEFLGRVRLVSSAAELGGTVVYNRYLKHVPLRTMFLWCALVGTAVSLTQLLLVTGYNRELGLDDQIFSLGDSVVLTLLGQISFLPVLVLAARICPRGVEATLFASLMSLLNAGGFVSGLLGSGLTAALGVTSENFDNLTILVLICCLAQLLPLPLLRMVPGDAPPLASVDDKKGKKKVDLELGGVNTNISNHNNDAKSGSRDEDDDHDEVATTTSVDGRETRDLRHRANVVAEKNGTET